ncbi:MAG: polysaccharide biosynthesis tyrosine autokinase, partial [Luminiphilus sp.]|nr:polysaccharide biosynthesis tyrosine autokinase [Luminiphilus sp.]
IIRINHQNTDADLAEIIVDEILGVYVAQNIRRLSAEAENSLKFMREQIPFVQRDLELAEQAFNKFASENQSIDVSAENQAVLNQLVELDTRIQELELQRVELNRRFTANHPNVVAAEEQYRQLVSERARFNSRIEALPDTQQQLFSLRRDVEVANEIYQLLLYNAQEMEVAKASTVGNVRIIDPAIVDRSDPVAPKKALIAVIGTLLGGLLGVAIVLIRRAVYRGIESADTIEAAGINVFASVPHSEEQQRWDVEANEGQRAHKAKRDLQILADAEPTDLAVEMLRNLRTSLYFNLTEASNKAVMISGPSPGVGKSFISVNLAITCAQAGQKVLLIDADMRRGYLHRYFHKRNQEGLSNYLAGQIKLDEAIFDSSIENVDVITRGKTPPNPAELLEHSRLDELIAQCNEKYDVIIFDTPPMLAVTDASIVAQKVGNTLLVCRFEKTSKREVEHSAERLVRNGVRVTGAVLNGVKKRLSNYYGYGGYYGYGYGYKYQSKDDS